MNRAGRWGAASMVFLAAVAAVISYTDGLFLVRLAGNGDWRAFLYPLLPDVLIVICLIALLEGGKRAKWPSFGLALGIGLTLAMNVAAGVAHSVLDAVVDGFVPVVFFVAVEVFIGYVKRGRAAPSPLGGPAASPAVSPGVSLPGVRELQREHQASYPTAKKIRAAIKADRARNVPAVVPATGIAPATAGAHPTMNGHHG